MPSIIPSYAYTKNPYVVWPYYTGRDKGLLADEDGVQLFYNEGFAWRHIFTHVQPNDERACTNYRVLTLREYRKATDNYGFLPEYS